MDKMDLTSGEYRALARPAELMERLWAPCRHHCPAHADVRGYIEAVAQGRMRDAIDIIRRHLPFAAVCGRVCHHPCEANCRRQKVDDPVAIREVKRHVAELQGAVGSTVQKPAVQDKARVAIVGAGPAGLSAGLYLAKAGYRPTVFEKFPVAGGIPATGIPSYRLPRNVVQIDVDWICAHGVELVTGVEIGKDRTIDQLLAEGFSAVLIATGLPVSRTLPMPAGDHKDVHRALEFLTALTFGPRPQIGQDVLVIGGGNVACDAARSSVRLGARRVRMMCLETAEEMPAYEWERREGVEEGIEIIHRRGPVEVKVAGGRIVGLKARKVTRVFDEQKRFDPRYDDYDTIELECDTVIIAIGQAADLGFIRGSGVKLDGRRRLVYDPATHQTSVPNVFACGEIVTPPGAVVEACAHGRRAAGAIDLYLSGCEIGIDDALPPFIEEIAPPTAEKVPKVARQAVPSDPPGDRKARMTEFEHSYEEPAALAEARRCMNCGSGAEVLVDKCAACLTCLRVCPFGIPKVTDVARIESTLCQACGICIAECPANAIVSRCRPSTELGDRIREAMSALPGGVKGVAYVCGHHATAADWSGQSSPLPGMAEIYLTSTARLSALEILQAFELGARKVVVVACQEGSDRYPQAVKRTRLRVAQARKLLGEAGLDPQSLQLLEVADEGRQHVLAALAEAQGK